MRSRNLSPKLDRALGRSPVVLLVGARQVGKSTLVSGLPGRTYLTLDNLATLGAAREDPAGFIQALQGPVTIDEVQRVPDLLIAIKAAVDRDRTPGRFLLTGSADVLLLPRVAESLAGRIEVFTLWPLTQGEIEGTVETFIDRVFADSHPDDEVAMSREELANRIVRGGYPEVVDRSDAEDRDAWFRGYLTTVAQREVRELANIERLADLGRLMSVLSSRTAGLVNVSDIGRSLGIPSVSLGRYLTLLEQTFLLRRIGAWQTNLGARLAKSPKLLIGDTGLAAHSLGRNTEAILGDGSIFGPLLETFVGMEIVKQLTWAATDASVWHLRTVAGTEVDFVLEDRAGRIVGIEVKATATPKPSDMRGLKALGERVGKRFVRGVLLYTGEESVAFDPKFVACPIGAMWRR